MPAYNFTLCMMSSFAFLAHLSRRLTRRAYRMGVEAASVRTSVNTFKHEHLTVQPVKFYPKHYWDGGKAALGFGPDRI